MTQRRKRWRGTVAAWPMMIMTACGAPHVTTPGDLPPRSVLFLGNSLTYYNDLPMMVERAAQSVGVNLRVGSVALPNVGVIDHADGVTPAPDALHAQRWDLVIVQQGPTPEGICRDTLVLGTARLATMARASGARVAVWAPWTRITVPDFLPETRRSAVLAAAEAGGAVLFVGDAWRIASEIEQRVPLYDTDGYHPAISGSWLAALLIVEQLFQPPEGWPAVTPAGVPAIAVTPLRRAAREAARLADSLRGVVPAPRVPPYPGPC